MQRRQRRNPDRRTTCSKTPADPQSFPAWHSRDRDRAGHEYFENYSPKTTEKKKKIFKSCTFTALFSSSGKRGKIRWLARPFTVPAKNPSAHRTGDRSFRHRRYFLLIF